MTRDNAPPGTRVGGVSTAKFCTFLDFLSEVRKVYIRGLANTRVAYSVAGTA